MGQLQWQLLPVFFSLFLSLPSLTTAQFANTSTLSFAVPSGYTSATFNASAQPTSATPQTDFSNSALALLWNFIGPVSIGPVTTTIKPTPEPTSYAQPLASNFHPLVASKDPSLANLKLPEGFKWGLASSAYQIEGAAKDEGKGPSIWDLLSHRVPNFVSDNTTGDVVGSHYWLYKQDFARLKGLGIKAFSPSISWPRIFPFGKGPINEAGVKHYDDVIAELHANGITPAVTLFHWDTPLALYNEYGAWSSPQIVDDFFNYAKFIISRYDAYVDEWFTINEPQYCNWQFSYYPAGKYYPTFNSTSPVKSRFLCGHYSLLAHARVAKWYHEEFKGKGRITFKNSGNYYEANSTKPEDEVARQRNFDFAVGWFGGPWTDGDYPKSLKDTLGDLLPTLTQEEKTMIKGSCDFYAIDGYSSFTAFEVDGGIEACVSNRSHPGFPDCAGSASTASNGFPLGPAADPAMSWLYDTPTGIRKFLKHLTTVLFPSIPDIVVTEFGFAEPFEAQLSNMNQILWDLRRADYFQSYLDSILASIHYDKVNVTGAWGWAIFDNFEWGSGTSVRFGLQYHSPPFVLADEIPPNPPTPVTSDRPAIPNSPASPSPEISALFSTQQPTLSASGQPSATPATSSAPATTSKRRHSLSESSDDSESSASHPSRGRPSRHISKRRRRADGTMRLDNDASKRSQSPIQNFSNGSTRSPGYRGSLGKVANGDSHTKAESNGSTASYTNGSSVANGRSVPTTFFGHDREEVTRILIQSLTDLGYHGAAGALCKESGYQLEGPTVASFRSAVLKGDWAEAEELLFGTNSYDNGGGIDLDGHGTYAKSWAKSARSTSTARHTGGLTLAEGANRDEMLFWMKQQKYLELLERRDLGKALMVLRQELTPLHQDVGRLHALSSLMMCQSADDLKFQAQWDGAKGDSRTLLLSELSKSISPSVMIPEHRLAILLDEVKQSWISNCLYHNTAASPSLYVDHTCDRDDFPMKPVLELRHHSDEVWYLKFSNDGTKLASTSKDRTVVIYDTTTYKLLHKLNEHDAGVTHVAWSPDDTRIITCCTQQECSARIWDVKSGRCITTISDFTYPCTTAGWAPDGKTVVIGSQDTKYGLAVWDTDGNIVHRWIEDNLRVNDLAISPDGQRLVVLLENRILVYDFTSYEKICEWTLDDIKLTSVNISQDSQHMLISMNENKIKLMEIDTGEIIQRYSGQVQTQFIIRSAFGGANENFVVSGSEDSRIYIWRTNGLLVDALDAHPNGCVNSIAWHPTDPKVFASAGDDMKVRIWKPAPPHFQSTSNGYSR
ncbi:WD repeat-containing protein 26 [Lindgomyces ingoldianus]|uniref:WD repeat-containing protein 26 n=1 Tax=Lindgomyces ingoldianus TaxID=673940 RepID=A0ACB6QP77_9PLEO|nr:WD repeat-containing protein 26 [Lindgomyces ingoldianus]KAF2467902.1 WD repeat-containing protein 26 [Lindgomyces ingoldianus]